MKKTSVKKPKTPEGWVDAPRGLDPESMMQQDHLLVKTMRNLIDKLLQLGPDDEIYVTYSSGYSPGVLLHFIVHHLDGEQISMLQRLQSDVGYEETDVWPRVDVNIFSGFINHEKKDFEEYTGQFEVEVAMTFTAKSWNDILAEKHEASKPRKKKKR